MSTRSAICRQAGDSFEGRYHHWDGYPAGVGSTLFELYQGHFGRDLSQMLRVLLDEHPAGWSTINEADWSLALGYTSQPTVDHRPACYCHGSRHEDEIVITEDNAQESGCRYVYLLTTQVTGKDVMFILSHDGAWKIKATIDLNGPAPEWEKLESVCYPPRKAA